MTETHEHVHADEPDPEERVVGEELWSTPDESDEAGDEDEAADGDDGDESADAEEQH